MGYRYILLGHILNYYLNILNYLLLYIYLYILLNIIKYFELLFKYLGVENVLLEKVKMFVSFFPSANTNFEVKFKK